MDIGETSWLAGILEGEGSFTYTRSRRKNGWAKIPRLCLAMTDRDIVARAAVIMEGNILGPYHRKSIKSSYLCAIHGDRAIYWMWILYWFFGVRRQKQIRDTLDRWLADTPGRAYSSGKIRLSSCERKRALWAR